jgi:hypothetical protein
MADKTVNEILKENLEPHEFNRIMKYAKIMHILNTPDDVEIEWIDVIAAERFRSGMFINGDLSYKLNNLHYKYSSGDVDAGEFNQMDKNFQLISDWIGVIGAAYLREWEKNYYAKHGRPPGSTR